ncbi:MAG: hypothetical protein ACKVG9_00110 [Rhodospirillales bacterium]|tara:strand:+ start:389 stop:1000 length:612 start_codon:yes stop_codon:yes gene_type:complete
MTTEKHDRYGRSSSAEALNDTDNEYSDFVNELTPLSLSLLSLEEAHRVGERGGLYWPIRKLLQGLANQGQRQVTDAAARRAKTAREIDMIFRSMKATSDEIPVGQINAKVEFIGQLDFQECFGKALRDTFAKQYEELTNETWKPYSAQPQTRQSTSEIEALRVWAMKAVTRNESVKPLDNIRGSEEEETVFDSTKIGQEFANN